MAIKQIEILPSIYTIEVTSHSNNKSVKSFCLYCLSQSKANKEYKQYANFPNISSIRICSKCGAMTLNAVKASFDLNLQQILSTVERRDLYKIPNSTDYGQFSISETYLHILQGQMKNG